MATNARKVFDMRQFHEFRKWNLVIHAVQREVRVFDPTKKDSRAVDTKKALETLMLAGNRGGAFPVIAHRWVVSASSDGRVPETSGFWFSRKFRSHAEAVEFARKAMLA